MSESRQPAAFPHEEEAAAAGATIAPHGSAALIHPGVMDVLLTAARRHRRAPFFISLRTENTCLL